jgi:osmotically-inducible protein OsmY
VDEKEIAVQAHDGVVTLAGTVESWAARNAAVEAAHRVAGVLDVANEMEVAPTSGPKGGDAEIAHAARQSLAWDALAPAEHIHVTVAHGCVTLSGTVQTMAERTDAERAVERLRGVRNVDNKIEIRPKLEPGDLQAEIESALKRQSAGELPRLQLGVSDGHVIVEGRVHSAAERRTILGTIRGTRGVATVDDRLVVEG